MENQNRPAQQGQPQPDQLKGSQSEQLRTEGAEQENLQQTGVKQETQHGGYSTSREQNEENLEQENLGKERDLDDLDAGRENISTRETELDEKEQQTDLSTSRNARNTDQLSDDLLNK